MAAIKSNLSLRRSPWEVIWNKASAYSIWRGLAIGLIQSRNDGLQDLILFLLPFLIPFPFFESPHARL